LISNQYRKQTGVSTKKETGLEMNPAPLFNQPTKGQGVTTPPVQPYY